MHISPRVVLSVLTALSAVGRAAKCVGPLHQECDAYPDAFTMLQQSMALSATHNSKARSQDAGRDDHAVGVSIEQMEKLSHEVATHTTDGRSEVSVLSRSGGVAMHALASSSSSMPYVVLGLVCSTVLIVLGACIASYPAVAGRQQETCCPPANPCVPESNIRLRSCPRRSTFAAFSSQERACWVKEDSAETMSSTAFVVNICADLCPNGLLPLSYGLRTTGFVPAFAMLLVFYGTCVYSMWMVGRTAAITDKVTFMEQWEAVIGAGTSWVPVAVVAVVCFGCNLAYACFYGDIFSRFLPTIGLAMPRYMCILTITVALTMPLCLLKDLSGLAPSSTFALICVIYTAVVMVIRWQDGTYVAGGRFYSDLTGPFQPHVPESHEFDFGFHSMFLVNALAVAFCCHYNACKYYRELKGHSPAFFCKIVAFAMGICTLLFGVTMVAGFKTFGTACNGVVLDNYSRDDWPVNVAKIGTGLSIVASFPLMFSGLRESVITLLQRAWPESSDEFDTVRAQDGLSLAMVSLIMVCAMLIADVGVVVGVVGSVCGSAIIYVIPCSLYAASLQSAVYAASLQSAQMSRSRHTLEVLAAKFMACFGAVLGMAGFYATLWS